MTSSILPWLKSRSTRGACHHSTFLALVTQWMSSLSRKWECGIGPRLGEIKRNRRDEKFKIPLCKPSGRNLVLRQSCTQNSLKHQRLNSSAKIANSLNIMTVPAKRLHHRPPTGLQVRIWLEVLCVWSVGGLPVHGIGSCRLVHKEGVEVGSNYKRTYFW